MEGVDDVEGDDRADARPDRASVTAATIRSPRSPAATSSGSTSRSDCSPDPPSCCSTNPAPAWIPSQRVRLWEFVAGLAKAGTTVIYSTHQIEEASHYGDRLVVLADGETIFDGSFSELRRAAGPRPEGQRRRSGERLRPLPSQAGPLMRWLLVKDLQLLRRSPLVTGLLILYPIVLAVLIGLAISRSPGEAARRVPQPDPAGTGLSLGSGGSARTRPAASSASKVDCVDRLAAGPRSSRR